MTPGQVLAERKADIWALAGRHRARRVRVFGSAARGQDTASSDLDVLVDFEPGASLLDQVRLRLDLEELLGVPVDVVSTGGLEDRDGHILAEAVDL